LTVLTYLLTTVEGKSLTYLISCLLSCCSRRQITNTGNTWYAGYK